MATSPTADANSARPILKDGDQTWVRVPYQVSFGKQFTSTLEGMKDAIGMNDESNKDLFSQLQVGTAEEMSEFLQLNEEILSRAFYKDTRVGANDAINCQWQFNRDDDIVYPMLMSEQGSDNSDGIGMGRVYASTTEMNQTIAWFQFGVPRFTNLVNFFKLAFEADIVKMNATGGGESILSKIKNMFVEVGAFAITLPLITVNWVVGIIERARNYETPSRFYEIRSQMHMYYRYVDSILAEWLVDVGLYGAQSQEESKWEQWTANENNLPLALRLTGPTIFNIISRKAITAGIGEAGKDKSPVSRARWFHEELIKRMKQSANKTSSSPFDAYTEYDTDPENIWNDAGIDWSKTFKQSMLGATQYVGFRIEKNVDANESFSNSTKPSEVAEKINSMAQAAETTAMNGGAAGSNFQDLVSGFKSSVAGILGGTGMAASISNVASSVMQGAFIDIPEAYQSSDFNKSHSLSFQLRAPYGDITSIYQSIMVPLALLLAGALPRAAGANSYQQPFLCRVYCKGLFAVPMGIIDSISIKRGSSEFGWTYQSLPTCVDVNVSIKDLAPAMYMAMDTGYTNLLGANNSFQEYLLTLAGVGLWDRTSKFRRFQRRVQLNAHNVRNQLGNPLFHASWISDSTPATFIQQFLPWSSVSRS